nr:hypothetical protein [uncultured bacterium]
MKKAKRIKMNKFNISKTQAALDAGRSLIFEAGIFNLGDADTGFSLTTTDTHITAEGNVLLLYEGTGHAIELNNGYSGRIEGLRIQGIDSGIGVFVNGGFALMRSVEIRNFNVGLFLNVCQVGSFQDFLIQSCSSYGIDTNVANDQNHIAMRNFIFRVNGVHMRLMKARNIVAEFFDFEAAKGYALELGSSGGGSFQAVVFKHCWFEANNTDYLPKDERGEIYAVSKAPFTVRGLRFESCFWALLNGEGANQHNKEGSANASKYHLQLGSHPSGDSDKDNTTFVGGKPDPENLVIRYM